MRKKLLLLLNPNAGQKRANKFLPQIIRLYNDYGYDCVVYVTAQAGDATEYLTNCSDSYDRVVCIGGDGTLNETIAGLIAGGKQCPAGYIPAGTTNDYAVSLGLSSDIMQAASDSVEGVPVEFDLGCFNGRYFNYTASCGAFAKASYSTPQSIKNAIGHLAYIMEGILDLPSIRPIHMQVTANGKKYEDNFIFCSITNSLSIGGVLKLDPKLVSMNDGSFEVMLIRYPQSPVELTRFLAALRSFNVPCEGIEFFKASEVDISVDEPLEWTLDGERSDASDRFEIRDLPRKMRLVLPTDRLEAIPVQKDEEA